MQSAPTASPSTRRVHCVDTPNLIERIRRNDDTLRCLRIGPELLTLPTVKDALQRNQSIRSIILVRISPKVTSATLFAHFLECLYHLPLRSVQASDLQLPSHYMDHLLHLVEYASGVGVDCQWAVEDKESAAAAEAAAAAEESETGSVEQFAVTAPGTRKALPMLGFLDLSGNALTETQAMWLGRIVFHTESTLRRVNVSECRLGNVGMKALLCNVETSSARFIGEQPIQTLTLRWNSVTEDDSFGGLLDVLSDPTCRTHVEIQGNYVSSAFYRRVAEREKKLRSLKVGEENEGNHLEQNLVAKPTLAPWSALRFLIEMDDQPGSNFSCLREVASTLTQ